MLPLSKQEVEHCSSWKIEARFLSLSFRCSPPPFSPGVDKDEITLKCDELRQKLLDVSPEVSSLPVAVPSVETFFLLLNCTYTPGEKTISQESVPAYVPGSGTILLFVCLFLCFGCIHLSVALSFVSRSPGKLSPSVSVPRSYLRPQPALCCSHA